VVVEATYAAPMVVPGMDQLISMVGGSESGAGFDLNARAVARCEVVRQ
jgi:hypothetical protein